MSGPNEPLRMNPQRQDQRVYDDASGDAGRDGYTRIARRTPRGRPGAENDSPFSPYGSGSDEISPRVAERDWNRGPRFSSEDC